MTHNDFGDNALGFVMGVVASIPYTISEIARSSNIYEFLLYPFIAGVIGILGKEAGKCLFKVIKNHFKKRRNKK